MEGPETARDPVEPEGGMLMKPYLASLVLGILVGVIYGLFQVRSPAPPIIALVGLLGILLGEQLPPLARQLVSGGVSPKTWLTHQVKPHVFGPLPCAAPPMPPRQPTVAKSTGAPEAGA